MKSHVDRDIVIAFVGHMIDQTTEINSPQSPLLVRHWSDDPLTIQKHLQGHSFEPKDSMKMYLQKLRKRPQRQVAQVQSEQCFQLPQQETSTPKNQASQRAIKGPCSYYPQAELLERLHSSRGLNESPSKRTDKSESFALYGAVKFKTGNKENLFNIKQETKPISVLGSPDSNTLQRKFGQVPVKEVDTPPSQGKRIQKPIEQSALLSAGDNKPLINVIPVTKEDYMKESPGGMFGSMVENSHHEESKSRSPGLISDSSPSKGPQNFTKSQIISDQSLKAPMDEFASLKATINYLNQQNALLQKKADLSTQLSEENTELVKQLHQQKQHTFELECLRATNIALCQQLSDMKKINEIQQNGIKEASKEAELVKSTLGNEISRLKTEIQALVRESDDMESLLIEAENKRIEQSKNYENKIEKLKSQLTSIRTRSPGKEQKDIGSVSPKVPSDQLKTKLGLEIVRIEEENLRIARETIKKKDQEIQVLADQLKALKDKMERTNKERENDLKKSNQQQEKINNLSVQIESLESKLKKNEENSELDSAKYLIKQLETMVYTLKIREFELRRDLDDTKRSEEQTTSRMMEIIAKKECSDLTLQNLLKMNEFLQLEIQVKQSQAENHANKTKTLQLKLDLLNKEREQQEKLNKETQSKLKEASARLMVLEGQESRYEDRNQPMKGSESKDEALWSRVEKKIRSFWETEIPLMTQ